MERHTSVSRALPAVALLAALSIAVLALGIPVIASALADDPGSGSASEVVRRARQASDLPPVRMRVVEVERGGFGRQATIESAEVRWHTIFNVPYGTTAIDGPSMSSDWNLLPAAAAWLAFLAVEGLLLGLAVLLALR